MATATHTHVFTLNCWLCDQMTCCDCGECLNCGAPANLLEVQAAMDAAEKATAQKRRGAHKSRFNARVKMGK